MQLCVALQPSDPHFYTSSFKIPLFAVFKVYSSFIAPFLKARNGAAPAGADGEEVQEVQSTSKRQEKLKKRQERGDPRIQSRTVKRAA